MLTGDVAPLALSTHEENDIGDALAACLETLPAPIGETVGMIGPWGKLCTSLGGAVLKRMALIAAAKAAQRVMVPQGPRGVAPTVPQAPAPAGVTVAPNGDAIFRPTGIYDVVAPVPQGY